jgi:hypothetical protein
MAVTNVKAFWEVTPCSLADSTNVSKEILASIFSIEQLFLSSSAKLTETFLTFSMLSTSYIVTKQVSVLLYL